ncbi:MAG: 5-formyltetrahydrofolate cyclo-ligase [Candidatus Firestonebacteria bacterium]|nr:5-formyltetrahydrofolate cyclo-ligase [Candidatus Firestonebacteria bacterium]
MKKENIQKYAAKIKLRNKLEMLRNTLKPEIISKYSANIMKKLFSLPEVKRAKNIMFYISFNNEVVTHNMIAKALRQKKEVLVPITDIKTKCITLSRISEFPGRLKKTKFGVLEPERKSCNIFRERKIDVIVVPGLGFDQNCNRIGYGGGFYDKLLGEKVKAFNIGIAFNIQLIKNLPIEKHDISLDLVITEKRIIRPATIRKEQ